MSNFQTLSALIWNVADDVLRGLFKPHEYGDVILPFVILRDYERIPPGTNIDQYYQREVQPHLPSSWMDRGKDKTGYEINFTKYFYKYKPLRSVEEITKDLLELEKESEELMKDLLKFDG
jgi:type I restriction-modification system DNA methylase subunit